MAAILAGRGRGALLAPVEVARPAPEALVERGPLERLVVLLTLAGPGQGGGRLGCLDPLERLLETRLLLALEERVVLERVLDRVVVDRHRTVQLGVALLEVEVLLDRAGEGRGVVLGRVVGERVGRNRG